MRMNDILTVEAAAELLGISQRTVREWSKAGKIPAMRTEKLWLFSRAQLVAWVEGKATTEQAVRSAK